MSTVSVPSAETHLATHAINQLGHGRAGPRALRTQLQSSGSAKPRWRLTLLQKAGVGRTGVNEGDTRIQLSPEGVIGRKATALRSRAERDSGSEACAAWEQELSNARGSPSTRAGQLTPRPALSQSHTRRP